MLDASQKIGGRRQVVDKNAKAIREKNKMGGRYSVSEDLEFPGWGSQEGGIQEKAFENSKESKELKNKHNFQGC